MKVNHTKYNKLITPEMVTCIKEFLGNTGRDFFLEIYKDHGKLSICMTDGNVPYIIHFREGMQIRNQLRECGLVDHLGCCELDDIWEDVTLMAIGKK